MNEQKYTFNGSEVLAGQFSLDPLVYPFQGEPGISYRNIATAVEQGPAYVLSQTPPASSYGRENNVYPGDWVVRDALSPTNYRIVKDPAWQHGTAPEVTRTVKDLEADAQAIADLNRAGAPVETLVEKRARLQAELAALG